MNKTLEKPHLVDLLNDLRINHFASAIKIELGTECISSQQVIELKNLSIQAGLGLSIKIRGCEAITDIYEMQKINPTSIVAPMIESAYALEKFIENANMVFQKNEVELFINIETIEGFKNIDKILQCEAAKSLHGIVFGRSDMCGSLKMDVCSVNHDKILQYALKVAQKTKKHKKKLIIGGGICPKSLNFLKAMQKNYFDNFNNFETRKIIFDAQKTLNNDPESAILKAIDFELKWLKNSNEPDNQVIRQNEQRINLLNQRKILPK